MSLPVWRQIGNRVIEPNTTDIMRLTGKKLNINITIGWLYPELMSTYGDRGNIFVLKRRCNWRKIACHVLPIDEHTSDQKFDTLDLIFGGGAQDRQQSIVISDLLKKRAVLTNIFDRGIPGLFVCGAPQLLGHYYTTANGQKLTGLGIFDMYTQHPGPGIKRCIGNLVCQLSTNIRNRISEHYPSSDIKSTIVGFENHGGRTFLGKGVTPLARVLFGYGNNGQDKTEGAVFKNCLATYSHGPFLSKNPHIADFLISQALVVKYQRRFQLSQLDDSLEWLAHEFVLKRYPSSVVARGILRL